MVAVHPVSAKIQTVDLCIYARIFITLVARFPRRSFCWLLLTLLLISCSLAALFMNNWLMEKQVILSYGDIQY